MRSGNTAAHKTAFDRATRLDERCSSCNAQLTPGVDFCPTCGARSAGPAEPEGSSNAMWDKLRARLEEATRGEYVIVGELGRGGMGAVFLARDPTLERHVAIKVLAPHLLADEHMLKRFQTEARIVAVLKHPGIVAIHKFRHVDDLHFFVMDYIEGVPLRSLIAAHGPLPQEVVRAVLYDVGSAIQHAHGRGGGVVHRDLKPGNIMLESAGVAVVTDFGISRAVGSQSGLTVAGAIIGTPEYMSPEQCRGGDVTPASDQYALGLVGYAMLAGAPPFTGQHYAVLAAHTSEKPAPLREVRPDVPTDLAAAIHRMLAKSPGERWPDIKEALKAFGGRLYEEGDPVRAQVARLVQEVGEVIAPSMPVASIGVSGLPDRLEPGDTISLEITPIDGLGRALAGRAVAILSRDAAVATVAADGSVTALAEGSARLVIQCEKLESEVALKVWAPVVAAVEVTVPNRAIHPGESFRLEGSPVGRRGQRLGGRSVEWTSSDASVATVAPDGVAHGIARGTTKITATCEQRSATVELRVAPIPVARINVVAAPPELRPGDHATLRARAFGPKNEELSDRRVVWSSATPSVVRVSPQGEIAAVAAGAARLVASCEGKDAELAFSVLPSRVERVWLSVPSEHIKVGDRLKPELTVMDARSNLLLDRPAKWESSAPGIVSVSASGEVHALKPGRAEVRVKVEDCAGSLELEIAEAPAEAVPTAPPPMPAAPAPEKRAAAPAPKPAPKAAKEKPAKAAKHVPTRAPEPRPVRSSKGRVAVAIGAVLVIAAAAVLWKRPSARGGATVANVAITSSTGAPVSDGIRIFVGETQSLSAAPTDASGVGVAGAVQWSSSDAAVASVSPTGVVTAVNMGSVRIAARVEGIVRDVLVTVDAPGPPPQPAGIAPAPTPAPAAPTQTAETAPTKAVTPAPAETKAAAPAPTPTSVAVRRGGAAVSALALDVGQAADLQAAVADASGRPVAGRVAWSSSDQRVATVDANGHVVAAGSGSATITAQAAAVSTRVAVTVAAPEPGKLQLVVLPFADIYVDDVQRGTGQRALELSLPVGTHRVRLQSANAATLDTTVVIRAGQTSSMQIRLQPR